MTRPPITHDNWRAIERAHWGVARRKFPTADMRELQKQVREAVEQTYGPCPPKPKKNPKPPIAARLALWWAGRRLKGLRPVEVPMLWQKLIVSLVFGIGATSAALTIALQDGAVTGNEWAGLVGAFVAAAWGKFSSNTTIIAPSRAGETIAGPAK